MKKIPLKQEYKRFSSQKELAAGGEEKESVQYNPPFFLRHPAASRFSTKKRKANKPFRGLIV